MQICMQICMRHGVTWRRYITFFTAHLICIQMQQTVYCTFNLHIEMYSLDVRFRVECVSNVIFSVENSKMTSKTNSTVKRTTKLHIENASVIDP
jgi:hypothetical protein